MTPERKALQQVEAQQTPERRMVPNPPAPSAAVRGQKRRAPDDFEEVNVPTQGFTAESPPEENKTPRVRRVLLNTPHSGLTPDARQCVGTVPTPSNWVVLQQLSFVR
jgi:hypothetical protein